MSMFSYSDKEGRVFIAPLTYVLVYSSMLFLAALSFDSLINSLLLLLLHDRQGMIGMPMAITGMIISAFMPHMLRLYAALLRENNELIDAIKAAHEQSEHWRKRFYSDHKGFRDLTLRAAPRDIE